MNNCVVYLHRKLSDNSIFYVGIGQPYRPYVTRGRSSLWNKVKKKYGLFVDVIKADLSRDDANDLEIMLISHYGRINNETGILVNLTDGGDGIRKGFKHSKEFKENRRIAMIGNSIGKGYKHTKKTKSNMSKSRKGQKAWNKGVPITEETRSKIKQKALRGLDNPYSRRVCVEGVWFDTMNEAGKAISNRTTVLNRCKSPKWNYFREGYKDLTPNSC